MAPSAHAQAAPGAPLFELSLKPLTRSGQVSTLEVTERFSLADPAAEFLTELPHVVFNVPTGAPDIVILDARDEVGRLRISARDVGQGDAMRRQWRGSRPTHGRITLRYRVPGAVSHAPRGPAPPIELRSEDGAVSGGGGTFLMRPTSGVYRFAVRWDLSRLAAGATGVSSLDGQTDRALPVAMLDRAFFMAGAIGRQPQGTSASLFYSAWQGHPPFDAAALMSWSEQLREHFISFFQTQPAHYGIMMRRNPVNPGGGIGLHNSLVATFDQNTDPDELQLTLSHEMFHTFQPQLSPAVGEAPLSVSWFNEGLAVFYQRELPFRAGMISAKQYLDDLNFHVGRYYTSAFAETPNSEVAAGFWRDTRIRTLPYDRGFLYFAAVDQAVRRASNGAKSLDSLVLDMRRLADTRALSQSDWENVLRRELGEAGVRMLHEALQGRVSVPDSGAFGPCFERVSTPMRRYELGFEPAALTESPRIVRGLIVGSAAEAAGLLNGDEILQPVGQDNLQGQQGGVLTLHLRRGDRTFALSYTPRGESVSAWQWARKRGVAEAACTMRG